MNATGTENPGLLRATLSSGFSAMRRSYLPLLAGVLILVASQLPTQTMNWLASDVNARQLARAEKQQEEFSQQMELFKGIFGDIFQGKAPTPPPAPPAPPTQEELSEVVADAGILMGIGCATLVFMVLLHLPAMTSALVLGAVVASGRSTRSRYLCGFRRYWQTFLAWMIALVAYTILSFPVGCIGGVGLLVQSFRAGRMLQIWDWDVIWIYGAGTLLFSPFYLWVLSRWGWALMRVADMDRVSSGPWNCYLRSWRASKGAVKWRVMGTMVVLWIITLLMALPGAAIIYFGAESQDESVKLVGYVISGLVAAFALIPWSLAAYGALYESIMTSAGDGPTPPALEEHEAAL